MIRIFQLFLINNFAEKSFYNKKTQLKSCAKQKKEKIDPFNILYKVLININGFLKKANDKSTIYDLFYIFKEDIYVYPENI